MKRRFIATAFSILAIMSNVVAGCSGSTPEVPQRPTPPPGIPASEDHTDETVAARTKYNSFNLVGVDQFGRTFAPITDYKADRQVGLFYWLWIGQPLATGIYDATKIAAMPNGIKLLTDLKSADPLISPAGQAHYWGEPLWGYYNSEDEWVIRKQMQMISMAGIDFIYFDTTNALIYPNVFQKVMKVIDAMLKEGWNAPRIVFYTHSLSFQTIRTIYSTVYKPQLYPDTWYRVNGKPMIIGYINAEDDLREAKSRGDKTYKPGVLSAEILNYFTFYKAQWPSDPVYEDGFPWIEWKYPQPFHTKSKVMSVSVASHPRVPMSFSLSRPNWVNWGRGWNTTTKQNVAEDIDKGTFFQAQWDHAIQMDPPMISVGGWNEWIAYKSPYDGEYMLCDAASKEFSRDIEPMNGGYQDAFFLQLISNVRKYKGVKGTPPRAPEKRIDITGNIAQWNEVEYSEHNMDHTPIARNSVGGAATVQYKQNAPQNKLAEIRVAHDADNVYFYLRGTGNFTDFNGENWMNILIGTGEPAVKKWESYEYLIGKTLKDGNLSVEVFQNGFTTSAVGVAKMTKRTNVIQISVPRASIGLKNTNKFYFKVAMGVEKPNDIMDYYQTGSVMPLGRLSYMYVF